LLALAARSSHGWIGWYWEEGLHLLFWRRGPDGGVVGAEVERIALLARVVGELPVAELESGRIVLADARGDAIFAWGAREPEQGEKPVATLALEHPLEFLRLEAFASPAEIDRFFGGAVRLNLVAGLGAVLLAMIGLAAYFFRESTRELREASQRVNFVTRVSHELKTPLTNVRLYAELLEQELEDEDETAKKRLAVIVAESQRLTRLIHNILTFSKHESGTLELARAPVQVEEVIDQVLEQFAPALNSKQIAVTFERAKTPPVLGDRDAIGQILANLISNVEKYASAGGALIISTTVENGRTVVSVADRGPGVPRAHRVRIFEPFYRVSDRLSDGVAGTGIGLTIARELARRHGGDLILADGDRGACFKLIL
jgi:signal transduction histidine kinase